MQRPGEIAVESECFLMNSKRERSEEAGMARNQAGTLMNLCCSVLRTESDRWTDTERWKDG